MRETRTVPMTEVREDPADGRKYFSARICNYGVADSFGTSWQRGVFKESLDHELPTAVFAHQWDRPIGRVVSYQDNEDGLDVTVRMSDLDANPDAKRMWHHLEDKEIRQFSFAFVRESEERADANGVVRITKASLDEVSPVLKGSVPGTRVLALRSAETISKESAATIITRFHNGEMDLQEALTALKVEAGTGEGGPKPGSENPTPFDTPMPDEPVKHEDTPPVQTPEKHEPDPDEKSILDKLNFLSRGK